MGKKPKPKLRKADNPDDFRKVSLTEGEIIVLLQAIKGQNVPALKKRLYDVYLEFHDQGLRLKELTKRVKANAFFTSAVSAQADKIKDARQRRKDAEEGILNEVAHLTAVEVRKLIEAKKKGGK